MKSLGGERVPVGGAPALAAGCVEQLARFLWWHRPGDPAAYGLGQVPLFPRDPDPHAAQTRTRSNLTEGQIRADPLPARFSPACHPLLVPLLDRFSSTSPCNEKSRIR